MPPRDPDGWASCSRKAPSGRGTLLVLYKPGDERWGEIAADFWQGRLPPLESIAAGTYSQLFRGRVDGATGQEYYFKRMPPRDWRDRIKHKLGSSRARRALAAGDQLRSAGLLTPRVACVIEHRSAAGVRESVLVTETVPEARNFLELMRTPSLGILNSLPRMRALLEQIARAVGRIHAAGFYHGDMRWGNLLCQGRETYWLDNERTRRYGKLPVRLRIQNLAQMALPTDLTWTDRLRMWRWYLDTCRLDPADQESTLRGVLKEIRRRWKKRGWDQDILTEANSRMRRARSSHE